MLHSIFKQYHALTKPRVIQLIVFCALIGMVLAIPGQPSWTGVERMAWACFGIWLVAGAAAACATVAGNNQTELTEKRKSSGLRIKY